LSQFNFIVVAGEEEAKEGVIDVRSRDGQRIGKRSVKDFVSLMLQEYPPSVPKPHPL
jgi:threonyl-tRNA synthetase